MSESAINSPVHALVGAWSVVFTYDDRPLKDYATTIFHAGGSMAIVAGSFGAHGSWQPSGPNTAQLVAMAPLGPAEGQGGWHLFEGVIEASGDGSTFVLRGVRKRPSPSGTMFESKATANGARISVGGSARPA